MFPVLTQGVRCGRSTPSCCWSPLLLLSQAQTGTPVQGRVVAEDGLTGIPQASVELLGVGARITSDDGSCRCERVELVGVKRLRHQRRQRRSSVEK